ncbi:MAG: chemotaxis protein CheD [Oscillospiraceae bacterium]
MSEIFTVGISDYKIALPPNNLITYALGSCVGICLYDRKTKISGLAHIMLPWSKDMRNSSENMNRYADTGITALLGEMRRKGANPSALVAKIAGGAQMFTANSAVFNIGGRNVEAVKQVLATLHIPIIAEQTGDNFGRTLLFYSETGTMEIRSATKETITA